MCCLSACWYKVCGVMPPSLHTQSRRGQRRQRHLFKYKNAVWDACLYFGFSTSSSEFFAYLEHKAPFSHPSIIITHINCTTCMKICVIPSLNYQLWIIVTFCHMVRLWMVNVRWIAGSTLLCWRPASDAAVIKFLHREIVPETVSGLVALIEVTGIDSSFHEHYFQLDEMD